VIFCKTNECRKFYSGSIPRSWAGRAHGARGGAYSTGRHNTIVIVRTDAKAQAPLIHELAHLTLAEELRPQPASVLPAWFNEGLAFHIANEAADCRPGEKGLSDLRKLDAARDWGDYTDLRAVDHQTYCQAEAEVGAWLARNGRERFFGLIEYLRKGGNFYDAYGPMLTQ
jgi:hypothetical protein